MSENDKCVVLPDGSAFGVMSTPLPKDHWLYQPYEAPPMGLRCGTKQLVRRQLTEIVMEAAKYAMVSSTMCGQDEDIDPDALVQNMVVGLLGYHTEDGLSDEDWQNPKVIPSEVVSIHVETRRLTLKGEE